MRLIGHAMRIIQRLIFLCLTGVLVVGVFDGRMPFAQSREYVGERTTPSNEYLLKAAFLYNFAKLTRWPKSSFEGPESPLQLCVLGDNPFGTALGALAGRKVAGRPIEPRKITFTEEAAGCHIVFVTGPWLPELATALESSADGPVLTVGDAQDFAKLGGTISMKTVNYKIRFEVNLEVARRSGLRLDVRLLQLADNVFTGQGTN